MWKVTALKMKEIHPSTSGVIGKTNIFQAKCKHRASGNFKLLAVIKKNVPDIKLWDI